MRRTCGCSLLILAACGGGGGGTPSVTTPTARLAADPITVPTSGSEALLTVRLENGTDVQAALLECDVELPDTLSLPSNPLQARQAVPTLDGDVVAGRYHVLCGDAQNRQATPLQAGPLFALRLAVRQPRQAGSHSVVLRNLTIAAADGRALPVDAAPTTVQIVVQ